MSAEREKVIKEKSNTVFDFFKKHGLSISILLFIIGTATAAIALSLTSPEEMNDLSPANKQKVEMAEWGLGTAAASFISVVLINKHRDNRKKENKDALVAPPQQGV